MSILATLSDMWSDGKRVHAVGTLAFSGNYTAAGVAIDFALASVPSQEPPIIVLVPSWRGYTFEFTPGSLSTNGKLIVRAGTPGAVAFSTLTSSGVAPTSGDTVSVGGKTYTFRTALTAATTANEVLIGSTASAAAALTNLKAAINADSAGAGTLFGSYTVANALVTATTLAATTLLVVNRVGGTIGNATTTTVSAVTLTWTSTVLASGVDAIATGLEITAAAFPTDLTATATAVPFYAIFDQLI